MISGDAIAGPSNVQHQQQQVIPNMQQLTQQLEMAQVSVASRIPDFWVDQPRLWFIQLEAILAAQKLSDEARYNLAITKLGKDVITHLTDFLTRPPDTRKYEGLKERLLAIFEESETRKIQKLIGEMELGDQRPSQLLCRMTELARGKISEDTLRILWQGHLPSAVRAVLAVSEHTEINKLAKIADKVLENMKPMQVSEVVQKSSQDTATIIAEIARISTKLQELEAASSRSRPRFNNNNRFRRNRSNSRGRRSPNSPDWLCYYHYFYRNKANKCVQPCNWKKTTTMPSENN